MIKYIGSKRVLVPTIRAVVGALAGVRSVVDLFSGTSRVGHALKAAGYQVHANDLNRYAEVLARCYVQADRGAVVGEAERLLDELRALPPAPGYVTDVFCRQARYFQPHNGARIDAMRAEIARWELEPELEAVLLVSLIEAADRVDSTTGVQMAYLKKWARRSFNDLELRLPDVLSRASNGKGTAHGLDAQEAARQLRGDVAYLDPPYNQHKYMGNYHVWETLVRWDHPETYGIACKRVDCRERKSPWNSRPRIRAAMEALASTLDVRHLVVSFNDEGYLAPSELLEILAARGEVFELKVPHKRYVGAQIGIFNPSGDRVGEVSHLHNHEHLFVVPETPDQLDRSALVTPP